MPDADIVKRIETCSLSRQDELKLVAQKFTTFLIQRCWISSAPISLNRVRELYIRYQEENPSRIHVNEIIHGLHLIHVVKKSLTSPADQPTLQFKSIILPTFAKDSINDDELTKPRIRVYTNQAYTFRSKASLEADISGLRCNLCSENFADNEARQRHLETTEHILRSVYRNDRNILKKSVPFLEIVGVKQNIDINEEKTFVVSLKNLSKEIVEVKDVFILRIKEEIVPEFFVPRTIAKGETFECQLQVKFNSYRSHSYPLVILLKQTNQKEIHNVLIEPEFNVLQKNLHDLGPSEPYQPIRKNTIQFVDLNFVSGRPLPASGAKPLYVMPLDQYILPPGLTRVLNRGFRVDSNSKKDKEVLNEIKNILMDESKNKVLHNVEALNPQNYRLRMQHLLWMEEHQMNRDLHFYDREDAVLSVKKLGVDIFHILEVPGLSENRPSVLRGDEVYVRKKDATHKYQGIVHRVERDVADLALSSSFSYVEGMKVTIEFSLNRITTRICHRAVQFVEKNQLYRIVFPKEFYLHPKQLTCPFKNPKVEANKEQHRAVRNIVNNTAFPAPYLIYGPPGTGKTSTIVEAIAQIHLNVKGVKICACAPSNSAADLIAVRLLDFVPVSSVYRIHSMSRSVNDIPEKLKKICNLNEQGTEFLLPKLSIIASKSIIVVTPITAGRVHGIGGNFFDYVFIDEAGHAEEPLTLVPAVGLMKRTIEGTQAGNLILAGDPKQLGPIIHSRLAAHLGLDMSLLERLMKQCDLYQKDPIDNEYDDRVITKLIRNYRSHPTLLHVPNKLFYDNELKSCADPNKINALAAWDALPKLNFPLIFRAVRGADAREKSSPSYFNLLEIQTVTSYIKELITTKIKGSIIQQGDIVVLTPYRKQVGKFREYFKRERLQGVEVKSVEEFQGQERKVVFISTVRSQEKFVLSDYQFGIGFLRNPKRFNVATTRAQALMIIVGNPDILQTDPCWRALINYCIQNGSFIGQKPKESVSERLDPNETLAINLTALCLTDEMPISERLSFERCD